MPIQADELRSKCFETVQHYYSEAFDCGQIGRIEILPISLNSINVLQMKEINKTIEEAPGGNSELAKPLMYQDVMIKTAFYCSDDYYQVKKLNLQDITPNYFIKKFQTSFLKLSIDVLVKANFTSFKKIFFQNIMNHLAFSLKEIVSKFLQKNPQFKGQVSLIATSFEALFLFDLLLNQESGPDFWKLNFSVSNFYAFGMPSSLLTVRNGDKLQSNFELKACQKFLNIVHRLDPIAQRIEPMIKPDLAKFSPESIENEFVDRIDFTIADGSSLESFSLKNYFTSELIILRITNEIYGSLKMDSGSL